MSYRNIRLTLASSAQVYCMKILSKDKRRIEQADKTAPARCKVAASIISEISARQNNMCIAFLGTDLYIELLFLTQEKHRQAIPT